MWQSAVTILPPAAEAVTLAQVKAFLRLEPDDDTFDDELAISLGDAITSVELLTSTRLITQNVALHAANYEDLANLPIGPVVQLLSVESIDPLGAVTPIGASDLRLIGSGLAMGIGSTNAAALPRTASFKVTLRVGYGDTADSVPQDLRAAILRKVRAEFDGRAFDIEAQLVNRRIWL